MFLGTRPWRLPGTIAGHPNEVLVLVCGSLCAEEKRSKQLGTLSTRWTERYFICPTLCDNIYVLEICLNSLTCLYPNLLRNSCSILFQFQVRRKRTSTFLMTVMCCKGAWRKNGGRIFVKSWTKFCPLFPVWKKCWKQVCRISHCLTVVYAVHPFSRNTWLNITHPHAPPPTFFFFLI